MKAVEKVATMLREIDKEVVSIHLKNNHSKLLILRIGNIKKRWRQLKKNSK